MPRLLPRGPRKRLTFSQEQDARRHYSRLLKRWPGAPSWRRALLKANAIFLALHPEHMTSEHGHRLIRQLAAKHTNRNIRLRGGVPGDEGRAVIQHNRMARRLKPFTDMGWRMPRS